jgi:hypothetical protein
VASSDSPSHSSRFATWREDYEAVLQEKDTRELFLRVEVAEAAIMTRRADLEEGAAAHNDEQQALTEALAHLRVLKRKRLRFR